MGPDQTDQMEQSDLGPYCLQYRPPKYVIKREQTSITVKGGKNDK